MIQPLNTFNGRYAVVTGGGTGMGRELVRQLVAEGCSVAMCDVVSDSMKTTIALCEESGIPQGTRMLAHVADVGSEEDLSRFRDAIEREFGTDHIHLLFNNAGIGGGGSFVNGSRADWERTFSTCWLGVYYSCRVFLPMLLRAERAHIVNTSSINGFWASLGPATPHTAYPAAKFAVKGFTEGLITDLRINAPHVTCSVVMPGHIGTAITQNSLRLLGDGAPLDEAGIKAFRERARLFGLNADELSEDEIRQFVSSAPQEDARAPTTARQAASIILDGVKANRWRILVGDDAHQLDAAVRADPEGAYDADWANPMMASLPAGR